MKCAKTGEAKADNLSSVDPKWQSFSMEISFVVARKAEASFAFRTYRMAFLFDCNGQTKAVDMLYLRNPSSVLQTNFLESVHFEMMFIKTAKEFTDTFIMLFLVLTMNDNIISDVESTYISKR